MNYEIHIMHAAPSYIVQVRELPDGNLVPRFGGSFNSLEAAEWYVDTLVSTSEHPFYYLGSLIQKSDDFFFRAGNSVPPSIIVLDENGITEDGHARGVQPFKRPQKVPERKCPTCGINPMSTAPWGQCHDCIVSKSNGRPTSLGDHTGESDDDDEDYDYYATRQYDHY